MKNIILKFTAELSLKKYAFLPAVFTAFSFFFGAIMVWIGKYIFNDGPIPANYIQITRIVGFGIFGLAGFVVMIRGELYQVVIIRGKWARMVGFFWWAFCWWYAIISIFYVL